jgi:hypothetical protein
MDALELLSWLELACKNAKDMELVGPNFSKQFAQIIHTARLSVEVRTRQENVKAISDNMCLYLVIDYAGGRKMFADYTEVYDFMRSCFNSEPYEKVKDTIAHSQKELDDWMLTAPNAGSMLLSKYFCVLIIKVNKNEANRTSDSTQRSIG